MNELPERIKLANLPTKIEKLERFSDKLGGPAIYIKRDDQTGTEISGNKVRKLEYAVAEAINEGADTLITCGGLQSNHARATAAVAAKLGLNSCLVLRTDKPEQPDGNHFLDKVLGAEIKFISREEYSSCRMEVMEQIKADLKGKGRKGYILPEGASNGIGTFGYYNAMEEILEQEKELDVKFDAIVVAVGSGGTYAGLFYANKVLENAAEIIGLNVCDDADYFKEGITNILDESFGYTDEKVEFSKEDINIIDGYVGEGYALSRSEELNFILELAKMEGIILDPVYTGKAMYGLANEIEKGAFKDFKNILFIHTGGLYGLFPKRDQFGF
jgi:D-cysteine desulfhydrase